MTLIKMLSHFRTPGMEGQIDALWDFGAYPEAISVISSSGGIPIKEAWWSRVLEREGSIYTKYPTRKVSMHPARTML